jgi:hypothetical protein
MRPEFEQFLDEAESLYGAVCLEMVMDGVSNRTFEYCEQLRTNMRSFLISMGRIEIPE